MEYLHILQEEWGYFLGIFQNDEEKGEKMGENQMSSKGICRIILIRYNEIECKLR